jgi:hypothetical protein
VTLSSTLTSARHSSNISPWSSAAIIERSAALSRLFAALRGIRASCLAEASRCILKTALSKIALSQRSNATFRKAPPDFAERSASTRDARKTLCFSLVLVGNLVAMNVAARISISADAQSFTRASDIFRIAASRSSEGCFIVMTISGVACGAGSDMPPPQALRIRAMTGNMKLRIGGYQSKILPSVTPIIIAAEGQGWGGGTGAAGGKAADHAMADGGGDHPVWVVSLRQPCRVAKVSA